jgi:hypothetical protein
VKFLPGVREEYVFPNELLELPTVSIGSHHLASVLQGELDVGIVRDAAVQRQPRKTSFILNLSKEYQARWQSTMKLLSQRRKRRLGRVIKLVRTIAKQGYSLFYKLVPLLVIGCP